MYNFEQIREENWEETFFELTDDDGCYKVSGYGMEPNRELPGYCFFNPNPRGCRTGDCVKRAIVVATGKDYKELELFMNRNKVVKDAYNNQKNYEHVIDLLGGKKIKMSVPAGKDRWHVTDVGHFLKDHPNITAVLQVSKHLIGVRNNIIYDLYDDRRNDKGIYKMFLFGATDEEINQIQAEASLGKTRRFCL